MAEIASHINAILKSIPEEPGIYQYYDLDGKILYVGKAKNLRKRVNSYFTKEHDNGRLRILVRKIHDIKTIKVSTEMDALLLENNLIKTLQPRYNINLKDDKTYPWVCIKKERFPRVIYTRKKIKDGSDYLGPFASAYSLKTLLDFIRELYPLRTCSLDLSEKNIQAKKFRPCLEYHIGRCKAPCVANQEEQEYNENMAQVKHLLKGNITTVIRSLKEKMNAHSEHMEFELAQVVKEKLAALEKFQGRSLVVNPSIEDAEVFGMYSSPVSAFVNYFKVKDGAVIQGLTIELQKKLDESDTELLEFAILELRQRFQSTTREIILPFEISVQFPGVEVVVPKIGDKKKLVELSGKNAENYAKEKEKQQALIDPDKNTNRIMQQMMKDLRMKEEPRRIDCFDNSNIQGAHAVSAMTVFVNGKPAKKEYRHYNVKTVEGPDDFATMEEVIFRRYSRVVEEQEGMPQLIVIDGGKGQLGAAINSLEKVGLMGKVTVIGIAKRLEEIYFPGDPLPLYIDKRSETLRILQHIRDEAHRFGITHHRSKRSRETIKTELSGIKGISDVTSQKLLIHFKSVKGIKEATLEELEQVIGKSKAGLVWNYFKESGDGKAQDEQILV
ncbi:MAG: uvrC [Bacteroidetes bacterium]|nr:uvrC [Bacteroidota bacterium]